MTEIIVRSLQSGERLPSEKQLAADLGVSRATVREMLSAFEASGTVVASQGSGRVVQLPDVSGQIADGWTILMRAKPAMLLELLEIRAVLEIGFLPKAIERLDAEHLRQLFELARQMKRKAENGEDFVREDREFHRILFSNSGNVLLEQLLKAFWELYNRSEIERQHGNLKEMALIHEKMVEAIAKQNTEQAVTLMKEQFADARYRVLMSLQSPACESERRKSANED